MVSAGSKIHQNRRLVLIMLNTAKTLHLSKLQNHISTHGLISKGTDQTVTYGNIKEVIRGLHNLELAEVRVFMNINVMHVLHD